MDSSHDSGEPMMCAFIEMPMGLLGRITSQTPRAPDLGGGWWGRHGELRLHISGILSSDLPRGALLWLGGSGVRGQVGGEVLFLSRLENG